MPNTVIVTSTAVEGQNYAPLTHEENFQLTVARNAIATGTRAEYGDEFLEGTAAQLIEQLSRFANDVPEWSGNVNLHRTWYHQLSEEELAAHSATIDTLGPRFLMRAPRSLDMLPRSYYTAAGYSGFLEGLTHPSGTVLYAEAVPEDTQVTTSFIQRITNAFSSTVSS
jgi:hypothetical protein